MKTINETVINKILNTYHANVANFKATQIKWTLDTKFLSAGNNHWTKVYKLIIEYQTNGNPQKTQLFVKVPSDCEIYETASKLGMYVKEETMYTKILPNLYTFEEEYLTARNYFADEQHSLFLEDLSQSGYKTGDRLKQLDFQHCMVALKSLAKLHALSVHLEKTSGLPEIIRENPFDQAPAFYTALQVGQTKFYSHLHPSIQVQYAEKIKFFKTIDWNRAMSDLKPGKSSFNVLNHGDYWATNIMFKYDKYGIVEKAKMVDFQLCRWGNPATDLMYFAITSMQFDVYSQYFHLLCTIYLDTLNKTLAILGYPSYKMEALERDFEATYAYGIGVMLTILAVLASDSKTPFEMSNAVQNNELDFSGAVLEIYEQQHYNELATKWFLHFAQKDLP